MDSILDDNFKVVLNWLEGKSANVNTTFTGSQLTMKLCLHLVKATDGKWRLIDDLPSIIK